MAVKYFPILMIFIEVDEIGKGVVPVPHVGHDKVGSIGKCPTCGGIHPKDWTAFGEGTYIINDTIFFAHFVECPNCHQLAYWSIHSEPMSTDRIGTAIEEIDVQFYGKE